MVISNYELGIIIAQCKHEDELDKILKAKNTLKLSRAYSKMLIEKSRVSLEREAIFYLTTIANRIGKDNITLRGKKRVPRHDADNRKNIWRKNDKTHIGTLPADRKLTNRD
ncbi:hypothetical protein DPMN_070733 [Dreissena polymorpha]|uniref:Uncharacterized protein n=1 Tax=Dreissena polymorpha TaxID=45954 RepID=A0A9D3Z5U3_DREPO|nr:hypothetical protein DPMN_070733 [Dreissena polymorpha]